MNTFDYNGAYSYTGERIVNESKGITLSLVDFQLHEHQSTTKGCYDELCEECFPDFNK